MHGKGRKGPSFVHNAYERREGMLSKSKEGTLSRAQRNFEGTLYMHYIRREGQREQEEERH